MKIKYVRKANCYCVTEKGIAERDRLGKVVVKNRVHWFNTYKDAKIFLNEKNSRS